MPFKVLSRKSAKKLRGRDAVRKAFATRVRTHLCGGRKLTSKDAFEFKSRVNQVLAATCDRTPGEDWGRYMDYAVVESLAGWSREDLLIRALRRERRNS